MCAIIGARINIDDENLSIINGILSYIWVKSHERGRDGRGYKIGYVWEKSVAKTEFNTFESIEALGPGPQVRGDLPVVVMIGNVRAEPTTEFVRTKHKEDQQPYGLNQWAIVHNGTIANDKELRTHEVYTDIDSAAIVERINHNHRHTQSSTGAFDKTIEELKGSFAILATCETTPRTVYFACNYRPIWYVENQWGTFFASSRDYFPELAGVPKMIPPYSYGRCDAAGMKIMSLFDSYGYRGKAKALVICSGGLDSVVSAAWAVKQGYEVSLIHFLYGSRAQQPEVNAISAVAEALGVAYTLFPLDIYDQKDSPLLDPNAELAGGEAGAEFASEWVPARNLVLMSVATAYAEARGIETLVLGNNLEEAGAYPDNEPEFVNKFNDMLPFAVGANNKMKVVMPVGNLMKHEIVALGQQLDAPMHLTWSCYRAGSLHCGKCGPCYMRRTAFEINGLPEVIKYAE